MSFEPVEAERSGKIIQEATEIEWRELDEYKLPLFSWDSRFDKLLTDLPGEETGLNYIWWASSYECYRDDTVGYDDHYSITIKREKNAKPVPAAWSAETWGHPYDGNRLRGRRVRFSAMVKTDNCTGQVRLGRPFGYDGDFFYGWHTHNADGTPDEKRCQWQFSKAVTGTNDWTPVSMEFTVTRGHALFLEQSGTGQCWFDNVKIEDLGPAAP